MRDEIRSHDIRNKLAIHRILENKEYIVSECWRKHMARISHDELPKQTMTYMSKRRRHDGRLTFPGWMPNPRAQKKKKKN